MIEATNYCCKNTTIILIDPQAMHYELCRELCIVFYQIRKEKPTIKTNQALYDDYKGEGRSEINNKDDNTPLLYMHIMRSTSRTVI